MAVALLLLAQSAVVAAVDPDDPNYQANKKEADPTPMPAHPTPADGATNEPVLGPLEWHAVGTADTRYVVDLAENDPYLDGNVHRICHAQAHMACDREARGTLKPNTRYYWQVTSLDGRSAQPGPVWSFTTGTQGSSLPTGANPNPPSGATDQPNTGPLTWSAQGTAATRYVVDLGVTNPPNPNTDRICHAQTELSCDRENLGELEPGTTYYWRVTSIDGVGARPGPVWSFTTGGQGSSLPTPYNPVPASPGTGAATTGPLRWSADGNAQTRYVVDLSKTNPPNGNTDRICAAQKHKTCSREAMGQLQAGTTYYWQVTSLDFRGATPGPVWQFTTGGQGNSLPTPYNPSPPHAAVGEATTGPLTWSAEGTSATRYVVDLSTSGTFTGTTDRICSAQEAKSCNREGKGVLQPATTYYWRVTSIDGIGVQAGPTWQFTTGGTSLPTASNPSPADGATGQATTGPLAWSAPGTDRTQYVVDLSKTYPPNGSTDRICHAQREKSCPRDRLGPLALGTTYYWQVTSIDGIGAQPGPIWSFTTQPTSLPEAANPSPRHLSRDEPLTGALTWEAQGTAATRYVVDLGTTLPLDGSRDRICHAQAGLSCNRESKGELAPGRSYYWQVTSIDGVGARPGPVWQFTTAGEFSTGDTDNDGLRDAFERDQDWPISVNHQPVRVSSLHNDFDSDDDGLDDGHEYMTYLNPRARDTDGDSVQDPLDSANCNAALADSDGDGLSDGNELAIGTNCLAVDTDGDQLLDDEELTGWAVGVDRDGDRILESWTHVSPNPLLADTDGDRLLDGEERLARTNPRVPNTDGDAWDDTVELANAETLPESFDAQSEPASQEMPLGPDALTGAKSAPEPCAGDLDCDGLSDLQEQIRGTSITEWDTDRDGQSDGAEVWMWRSDPLGIDRDEDGQADSVDVRPLAEDRHPIVTSVESGDFYKGVTIVLADQSPVTFLRNDVRFYHPTGGFECGEDFGRGGYGIAIFGASPSPWGAPLYSTQFHVAFVREEHGYYASGNNLCGTEFIAVLPFRDAFGNTVQVEVFGRANRECHVDPLRIVDLGLGVAAGPLANMRTSRETFIVFQTTSLGFNAFTQDPFAAPKFLYGLGSAHMNRVPHDFVGPPKPSKVETFKNVLRWLGPIYAGVGIATGDYRTCDDSTTYGDIHVLFPDEDTITDVQGREVVLDIGVAEGRAHAKSVQLGDAWRGLGDLRASEDGSGYRAWFAQTLQHPAHHYEWFGRYHVYCPADEAGGYVITSVPKDGQNRVMFVTAYAAMSPAGSLPRMVSDCPTPVPLLP